MPGTNFNETTKPAVTGTELTAFTPTGAWSTNTTYTGAYCIAGPLLFVEVRINLSGAPDSATLTINLPSGLQVKEGFDTRGIVCGQWQAMCAGVGTYNGVVRTVAASPGLVNISFVDVGGTYSKVGSVTESIPASWQNADYLAIQFFVPWEEEP